MSSYQTLLLETKNQVSTLTLNRPDVHNALNEVLISELHQAIQALSQDSQTRVIVLTGSGHSFCAGGDLNWMKKSAAASTQENIQEAKNLHQMLSSIAKSPKPVIAKVNGIAMGGGIGLLAATDMAFAYKQAQFALSEVRLGLIPAVISPFVIRKIGASTFTEYSLTAERFGAQQAKEMGLINHCASPEEIDDLIEAKIQALKMAGPQALDKAKKLGREIASLSFEEAGKITPQYLAELRASPEGKEGINAFLEKRKPSWITS